MIRASSTVRSNFSGVSWKAGAITVAARNGMKASAAAENTTRTSVRTEKTSPANRAALSSPFASTSLAKIGTKAELNAPSANSRRNRFGKRSAA